MSRQERAKRITGAINGFLNPLLLCAFVPIIEGNPVLDFSSPTGFWGQLIVATAIAEVLSSLPVFGRIVGFFTGHFGFDSKSPSGRIAGTVVGATLLFCVIGLGETAFTSGLGMVGERPFFSRWVSLVTRGWAFVVIGGLLLDPIAAGLGRLLAGVPEGDVVPASE